MLLTSSREESVLDDRYSRKAHHTRLNLYRLPLQEERRQQPCVQYALDAGASKQQEQLPRLLDILHLDIKAFQIDLHPSLYYIGQIRNWRIQFKYNS